MSGRPESSEEPVNEVPETMEGWYVLHDCYAVDWPRWRALSADDRSAIISEFASASAHWAEAEGGSACYRLVSQKGDLMWIHYRSSPADLNAIERELRACRLYDYLVPTGGYLSVIEASMYEATAIAHGMLARKGLSPRAEGWDEAFAAELETQKEHLNQRVYRSIPPASHVCYYPMNKRRGEHENWYAMSMDERRKLMRGHGKIGRKYTDRVTQVISGSVGLDDWEWAVDLHADDPLVFKKLVYEMRFDPASSRFAEFGEFYIGLKTDDDELAAFLTL